MCVFLSQVEDYKNAEAAARKQHLGIWEYGDITEDDAKEFGRNWTHQLIHSLLYQTQNRMNTNF